jgi:2,3-bisphosphoglycerate-independent phosphoglycerate mutase
VNQPLRKVLLIVLDGFGIGMDEKRSAITLAKKPYLDSLLERYPSTVLDASNEDVGLPDGQMGNSEVGHMNIGAGRVVYQEITRINRAIRTGEFFRNPAFLLACENARKRNSSLHLVGLVSDGGVHSHITHLYALLELAKGEGVKHVYVHAFLDGRDTPPESGAEYLRSLRGQMDTLGIGEVATVMGRYYGMDRDNRWERTEKAYRALTEGVGVRCGDAVEAVRNSYESGVTDEFVLPIVVERDGVPLTLVRDGDSFIFFNFRTDRTRQLTRAFIMEDFDKFARRKLDLTFVTMTPYHDDFICPAAFQTTDLTNTLGELVSRHRWKQLRLAETEKYAHVTFFFSGGRETPFEGEDRILVPSPRGVATYDLKPEMSAYEVTEKALWAVRTGGYALIVMNYANADMVGHSGNMKAAIKAVEVVDECLSQLIPVAEENGYDVIVTADHGNADKMIDDDGAPHTAHTSNRVPFIHVSRDSKRRLTARGKLADIAPTICELMGIDVPAEMDGRSLLAHVERGAAKPVS